MKFSRWKRAMSKLRLEVGGSQEEGGTLQAGSQISPIDPGETRGKEECFWASTSLGLNLLLVQKVCVCPGISMD